jgi:hypothetical protein
MCHQHVQLVTCRGLPACGVTTTALAEGGDTGYAVGSDGNLYAWEERSRGDGHTRSRAVTMRVRLPTGVTPAAVAGVNTGCAIGSDGNLYGRGINWAGQLGTPTPRRR